MLQDLLAAMHLKLARIHSAPRRRETLALGAILATGLAARLLLLPAPVHYADVAWFGKWAAALLEVPPGEFYSRGVPDCDYLPGYLYVLAATARLASLAGTPVTDPRAFGPWIKPVAIATDLLLAVVAFRLARRFAGPRRALLAAALVALNPGLALVSGAWGQVDSVGGVLSMLSLAALLSGNPIAAALWAGVAFAVKPQYTHFLAIAGVAYLRRETVRLPALGSPGAGIAWRRWVGRRLLLPVAALVGTVELLLLPFSVSLWPAPYAKWTLFDRLAVAANWDPVTTVNAFNLWGTAIAGPMLPDSTAGWLSLSYRAWGFLLLGAVAAGALLLAWIRAEDPAAVVWACFVVAYAAFALLTRLHDRYLFMTIPLLAVATALKPWAIRYYLATSALYLANVLWGYFLPDKALGLGPEEAAGVVAVPSTFGVLLLIASLATLVILAAGGGQRRARRWGVAAGDRSVWGVEPPPRACYTRTMERDAGSEKRTRTPRWALMAQRYYRQALADLDSARGQVEPRRYYVAVFLAQQAAEKGLKAAHWHLLAEEPEWTHRLEQIAVGLADRLGSVPREVVTAMAELTSGLDRSRYPSGDVDEPIPVELISESDAKAAVAHAEAVMAWVESLLQQPTGRPRRRRS